MSDSFWSQVEPIPEAGCLIWMHGVNGAGYGQLTHNKKTMLAHRVSWEITHGAIPKGMCILHRCDTPLCVNPHHLFLGTKGQNNSDRHRKGRTKLIPAKGESHGMSKLTAEDVINIRKSNETNEVLATIYPVVSQTIGKIRARKYWKHII